MGYEIERLQASIAVDLNETPGSLLSMKERLEFNGRIKENMLKLNRLIFENEAKIHSQRQNIMIDRIKMKELIEKLKQYNFIEPSREPSKYVDLQKEIKNSFESLAKKDFSMQNYFNLCETEGKMATNTSNATNATNATSAKIEAKLEIKNKKTKEKKENKIVLNELNRNSLSSKRKIHVPFLTDKECKSRAFSKPTYTNKDELIKTIERLGLKKHFKNPLQSYTKDQLCDGYFQHYAYEGKKTNKI